MRACCPLGSFPAGGVSRVGGAGAGAAEQGDVERRCAEKTKNEGRDGVAARNRKASLACCGMMTKVASAAAAEGVDNCHAGKCDVVEYERNHVHDDTHDTRGLESPDMYD